MDESDFLVKFIRILIEIAGILVDTMFLANLLEFLFLSD